MSSLRFSRVRPPFTAPGLWAETSLDLGAGWTAVVGPNGSGKTTLLSLACGRLMPSFGTVTGPEPRLLAPQVAAEAPGETGPWDWAGGGRWASLLGVGEDWWDRWPTLSAGERQRGLLAWCLAQEPGVLALDEPTNHLDEAARALVIGALARFEGVGLVASHDEVLLGALAARVLWTTEEPWVEQARWTTARREKERRDREASAARSRATRERDRLEEEGRRRRTEAHRAEAKNTKRGLDPKDSDGRARINGVRVSGKDARGSHAAAQWDSKVEVAREAVPTPSGPVKRGMTLKTCLEAPRSWSNWGLKPGSRVVVTGPNGSGKSTWLAAQPGLDGPTAAYVPQEAGPGEGRDLIRRLGHPDEPFRDEWMRLAARWGLDPRTVLVTAAPSPGEVQKLRLSALGLRPLALVALDEPTNHLDLEAKDILAAALRDFGGTLVLISHDRAWWEPLGFQEVVMHPGGRPWSADRGWLPTLSPR